ncbi:MAG: hypothetical protein J6E46_05180 [Faecalicoccus sp.]|nr:hypothetical protein [Faecalicoccus sp.]
MIENNISFSDLLTIELNLEKPFFQKLCTHDEMFHFKMPYFTEKELNTGRCDRIQSVDQLVQFIREVKTVDEQEGLLHELLKRVIGFSDLSHLQNLIITIQNTQKGENVNTQTLNYNFVTHEFTLTT